MEKESCRRWLRVDGVRRKDEGSERVKVMEVSPEERVKVFLELCRRLGIRKDKVIAANHNGKGPTSIDIFPNASIKETRLPIIHISIGKKGGLKYSVSSPVAVDCDKFPGTDDNPDVLSPARDLLSPVMEGTRVGMIFKTHLGQKEDKFVYCLDEDSGTFRIALPRGRHKKDAVEIGGERVIGLEFRPRINENGDAVSSGKVFFLGPP